MAQNTTPLAEQVRIVLLGLRNSGKSSLMNNLFNIDVSIVSENPGTTTDPVTRSMELGSLGPVAFTDTAGIDDTGELGSLRIRKSTERIDTADLYLFVTRGDQPPQARERELLAELAAGRKPLFFCLTFGDKPPDAAKREWVGSSPAVVVDNIGKQGLNDLKKLIIALAAEIEGEITPLEGLVTENELVLLVVPVDLAAPRGRLILPQVETIRDLLDKDCAALVVKERELRYFYDQLQPKPKLVVTDSQAFSKVAADIPESQPLTSFSILFARKKGDLAFFVRGVIHLKDVPAGSRILVLESCAHHKQADDIGTVKIPRLFKQLVQSRVEFDFVRSLPEPEKLREYHMVINCAGCMVTRNLMQKRLDILKANNIHAVNYGLFLAWVNGLLPRVLEPFPYEHALYLQ